MPQSLTQLYTHLIFSTKDRQGLINDVVREELHKYLAGTLYNLKSQSLTIGSATDHVHILFALSKNHPLCKIVEELKKSSSKWLKTKDGDLSHFAWQNGYGAFSVSPSRLDDVKTYILNQHAHHKHFDFQSEFRRLLESHHIEFDERYAWD